MIRLLQNFGNNATTAQASIVSVVNKINSASMPPFNVGSEPNGATEKRSENFNTHLAPQEYRDYELSSEGTNKGTKPMQCGDLSIDGYENLEYYMRDCYSYFNADTILEKYQLPHSPPENASIVNVVNKINDASTSAPNRDQTLIRRFKDLIHLKLKSSL